MTNKYSESTDFDSILADFLSQQESEKSTPFSAGEHIGFEEAIRRSENDLDDVLRQYVPEEPEKPIGNYERIGFKEAIRRSENDLDDVLRRYVPEEPPEPVFDPVPKNDASPSVADITSKQLSQFSAQRSPSPSDISFDPRFNLGGKRSYDSISYDGKKVDMSADKNYSPRPQKEYSPRQWTPEDIDLSEAEAEAEKKGLFKYLGKVKKSVLPSFHSERAEEGNASQGYVDQADKPSQGTYVAKQSFSAPKPYQPLYPDNSAKSSGGNFAEVSPADGTNYLPNEYSGSFSDASAQRASYASPYEYNEPPKKERSDKYYKDDFDYDKEYSGKGSVPSTFKDYVSSIFASVLYRFHRTNSGEVSTSAINDEDLGKELSPAEASKYYGSFSSTLNLRLKISSVLFAILCYISLGLPVLGTLKSTTVASAACMALQLCIMLLCLDVVTTGIQNCFRMRFGADSLSVLSCLITTVDCLIVIYSDFGALHLPLCAISSASLLGVTFASLLTARGLRKSLRVPAIGKICLSVSANVGARGEGITLAKKRGQIKNFVRRSEESAPDETLFIKAAPFMVAASLLLSFIVSLAKHDTADYIYILSIFTSSMVPFCSLLCFALPFFIGSNRIFSSGAAIAGWSGLNDVGKSKNLIITDSDLFPEGTVEMKRVRIFADEDTKKVISYAGTLIRASGAACVSCFDELMKENGCTVRSADCIEYLPGGGISGLIDGHTVLCGSTDLMYLMNVRVPFRFVDKTTVMLAIDGILYGIFNLIYNPLPEVRQALTSLMRSACHPVFAIHDFNITPEMLHNCFDIATDGYDFPPYVERFSIPAEQADSVNQIAAVICREGLASLSNMADTGRSMYVATRINLIVTIIGAVLGILTVFIKLLVSGSVSIGFILGFMLIWAIPVFLCSIFMPTR